MIALPAARVLDSRSKRVVKQIALFLLPLTALNPGFNFTLGDFFLLLAILLALDDLDEWPKTCGLLSLASGASILLASLAGYFLGYRDASIVDALQAWMIFTIVLPAGWVLAHGLSDRQVFVPIVAAALVNALAVAAQMITPAAYLPTQTLYGLGEFGLRPLGLTGNPNGLGLLMTWAVPMAVYLAMTAQRRTTHVFWSVATLLVVAGGILSLSKISMVMVVLALVASLVVYDGRRGGVVYGSVLIGLAFVWRFRDAMEWVVGSIGYRLQTSASFGQRMDGVVAAWRDLSEWAWIGLGAGADIVYGDGTAHIHNQWVSLAAQYGIPSALPFLAMVVILVMEGVVGWRHVRLRPYVLAFLVTQVSLLVHPFYLTRAHHLPTVLLLAALVANRHESDSERSAVT